MNIYDYIKESLLDDFDTLDKKIDTQIISDWFNQNATGNFKIKVNKKGTVIKGNVLIKGFNDENFPNLNISEFNGTLAIEKCPNLNSLDGLWVEALESSSNSFVKFEGSLIINNCPKLTSISCPWSITGDFQLVGNTSLRSLKGLPGMVTGNAFVMKNGKKFKEEQIRKDMYVGDNVFCSSDEELANLCESESIDEAMNNPYLLLLAKQLKETGKSFKNDFGKHSYVAWDQLDSSDVTNYSWRYKKPSDSDLKAARHIISGKVAGFIFVYKYDEDNKIKFIYAINHNKRMLLLTGDSWHAWQSEKSTELVDRITGDGWRNSRTDGMLIVTTNRTTNDVYKLRGDRKKAQEGIVQNTPEYYEEVARNNIRRYKQIIEANRANKKSNAVSRVQQKVDKFLQDIMKASQNAVKNPTKYASYVYNLRSLNEYAYETERYSGGNKYGKDGVLALFNSYMSKWMNTVSGETVYHSYRFSSLDEELDDIEGKIDRIIANAQSTLKIFDV